MDGRRIKAWVLTGSVLALAGCKTTPTGPTPAEPPGTAQVTAGKSSFFGGQQGFVPKPPAPEVAAAKPKVKRKGLLPETDLAFADTEMEAALFEGKPATERNELLDAARQRYQKVLAADPKSAPAMVGLARLYAYSGDKARSAQLYDSAIKTAPKDHDLPFQKARMLARFNDWNGAAAACQVALAADPENLKYPKAIAWYKAQAGEWDESFQMLMKRMPEADARYFLGRLLIDLDRVDEGREQMQMAMKANPRHADAQDALAMLDEMPAKAAPAVPPSPEPVRQATFRGPPQR